MSLSEMLVGVLGILVIIVVCDWIGSKIADYLLDLYKDD